MFKMSPSKYNTFLSCKQKYNLKYVLKEKGLEVKATSKEVGLLLHKVLEIYREGLNIDELIKIHSKSYTLSEDDLALIPFLAKKAIEMYAPYRGMSFKAEDYHVVQLFEELSIHGYIDKIFFHPETSKIKATIIDYKTGKNKRDNSAQLKFYFMLVMDKYNLNASEIEGKIFYLRLNDVIPYNFTEGELSEFRGLLRITTEIASKLQQFQPRTSGLCEYCEYTHKCTAYPRYKMLKEARQKRKKTT